MNTLTLQTSETLIAQALCDCLAQENEFYLFASNTVVTSDGVMEILDTVTDIDNIQAISEKHPLYVNPFYNTEDSDMGASVPDALFHIHKPQMIVLKKNLRFALSLLGIITPDNTVDVESINKAFSENRHAIHDICLSLHGDFDLVDNDDTKKDAYGDNLKPVVNFIWNSLVNLNIFAWYRKDSQLTGSLELIISSKHTSEKFVCPIEVPIEALAKAVL